MILLFLSKLQKEVFFCVEMRRGTLVNATLRQDRYNLYGGGISYVKRISEKKEYVTGRLRKNNWTR